MALIKPAPIEDIDESQLEVTPQKDASAGVTSVGVSMDRAVRSMGVSRATRSLLKLNQVDGFDCPGCAWPDPDPDHRHTAEFCENGAKAVAEEAGPLRVGPEFFAAHAVDDLESRTDYWLGQQGRITQPMVRASGASHYTPIDWEDAFRLVGRRCATLDHPDQAIFYTSGRTSNEAAFLYQLFVRAFGTNNLPDCSNMCHESTSVGARRGHRHRQGEREPRGHPQRRADRRSSARTPGTNHPRMLTALEIAKRHGATIIAVNPLAEAGLAAVQQPPDAAWAVGVGTELADLHLPIRVNGDLALFQALGSLLVASEELRAAGRPDGPRPGFISSTRPGSTTWADALASSTGTSSTRHGLARAQIEQAADLLASLEARR